ncbi:MAG TPA: hypothetical protein VJC13_00915 [Candidatus Paceibacterota bacterium]
MVSKYNKGAAMLVAVIFFLFASLTVVLGIINPILKQAAISKSIIYSKESYYLAEGALEDVVYRLKNNKQVSSTEVLSLNGDISTTTVANTVSGKQVVSLATAMGLSRKMQADVVLGTGISFHYGIQAGDGGFSLSNSSSVTGNIYSSGSITGSGNLLSGDAVSTGSSGFIQGVHITGSAYAHTLGASGAGTTVDGDAYYTTIASNVSVAGTKYPNSSDQATSSLPISDDQINEWEADALAGGIMDSSFCDSYNLSSNTCTISSSKSIGPKKIPFNLLIKSSSGVLTVTGHLWVTGNITAQTGPTIQMASALGSTNVAVIADNPADRSSSGIINIGQSTVFQGSGAVGSFVFMISQNNSAENGGSTEAISMNQGASALVAYAGHGQVSLSQSVSVKEVTAYKINLSQSANVTYDTGLPSLLFQSGPAGGYDVTSWFETQ